ncbi:unnamed protein product [Cylicocyclus nassatus]|uniref:Uncharacterized protein n=1 Tax=Cylicocyclus nassatus TaxID=53992 RepID=A0AA36HEJ9_CYLNA|nr:unnamed protein product [Cylicocyclus nassatus]
MSSYMDGPESTDSEFEDVFDAHFDRYSTRNSQLLRKVDALQIEVGRLSMENERVRGALATQENRANQLALDLQTERIRSERATADHKASINRCSARITECQRKIEEKEDEVERLLVDLYKARRNLPLKRGHQEGTHNVLLADMGEEFMLASMSRRNDLCGPPMVLRTVLEVTVRITSGRETMRSMSRLRAPNRHEYVRTDTAAETICGDVGEEPRQN